MNINKIKKTIIVPVIVAGISIGFVMGASAAKSEPGTNSDPLVTVSYVEQRLEQIKYYITANLEKIYENSDKNEAEIQGLREENNKLKGIIEEIQNQTPSGGQALEIVNLEKGQMLIADAGSEIIVRVGVAKAIAGELGGLSDVTGGIDIQMGEEIALNHLLIIPRSDGRGVYAQEPCILMVRGKYEIK